MNDDLSLIYAMFTILLVPFGGASVLVTSSRLRRNKPSRTIAMARLATGFQAVIALAITGVSIIGVVGWGLHGEATAGALIPTLVADSMMLLLLAAVFWVGLQTMKLSLVSGSKLTPEQLIAFEERLGLLQVCCWGLIGVPLLFVAPLAISLVIVPFMVIEGPASARRSKQGHLLWILAIATRRQQPLPALLDSYAESLAGGAQAFSLLGLLGIMRRSRFRRNTRHLADRLRDGVSLADALEDTPGLLPRSTTVAVRVGHDSGCLAEALERSATEHSRSVLQVGTVSDISTFFIYGAALLSATITICLFQMVFIVPKLKRIFEDFNVPLPEITAGLISASDAIASHLLLAAPIVSLPCIVLAGFGIAWFWGIENLRIPWLTRWWPRLHTSGIFRSLSLALSGEQTLKRALDVQIDAAHRAEVALKLERVRDAVIAGRNGWEALRAERLISSREQAVLESAQKLGNLSWALRLMADAAEQRLHRRVLWSYQVVRPIVISVLGVLVGYICVGFFLPLVNLLSTHAGIAN